MIISDKRPVKDCDWASQHTLHGASCHALSHLGPEHSHRLGAAHITVDDRGLDTARSIRLYPAIGGECKARQLLTKVLNHVISLFQNKFVSQFNSNNADNDLKELLKVYGSRHFYDKEQTSDSCIMKHSVNDVFQYKICSRNWAEQFTMPS